MLLLKLKRVLLQDNGELIAALVNVAKEEGRTIATCAEVTLQHYLVLVVALRLLLAMANLMHAGCAAVSYVDLC